MPSYEITFVYRTRSYDEHRRFLASVAASPAPNGIDGFRRYGSGVALTFVVHEHDQEQATAVARQRAGGIWPGCVPALTLVDVFHD